MSIERRVISNSPQLREAGEGTPPVLCSHVAVFNSASPIYWGVRESISPDFFDLVLNGDTPSLLNHDQNYILGRNTATPPTLRMFPDKTGATTGKAGLYTETDLNPASNVHRDMVMEPVRRGDIRGASFAFSLPNDNTGDSWTKGEDGVIDRVLLRASELFDVSPAVVSPYYPQTSTALRALLAARTDLVERFGAEPGDVHVLADSQLAAILADPQARMLTAKEVMLVAGAVALLEVLLPDDDGDEEEEPTLDTAAAPTADVLPAAVPSSPSGQSLYSLFKSRRKIWRALTWHNLPYKKCATSDKDTWDGPGEVKKSEVGDLKHMCLGYTDDGSAKGDYAGPHHENAPGYPVNKRGLIAARGRLNQINGGDVPAMESHLKKHYSDAGMEWDDSKAAPESVVAAVVPEVPGLALVGPAYLSLKARLDIAAHRMAL